MKRDPLHDATGDLGPYDYSDHAGHRVVVPPPPGIDERYIQDSRLTRMEENLTKANTTITVMQVKIDDLERRLKLIEVPDMLD